MDINPIVFLLGGLALLVSTATIALLNRQATQTENPYDDVTDNLDLSEVMWGIRHADTLYRTGVDTGREFPRGMSVDDLAASLSRTGLGHFRAKPTARRLEFTVEKGYMQGAQSVDEPLCYFTLGILQGALESSTGEHVRVTEETCHGTGGAACVFTAEAVAS